MTRNNSQAKRSRHLKTFLLGMLGVLCVIGGYALDLDSPAELRTLDMRFRYAAETAPSENVTIITIDDNSLHIIGRWPWPRATLAGIIETLNQCDAEVVMLDIILPRPQKVRMEHPLSKIYNPTSSESIANTPPIPIYDDAILAGTIAKAGNVFVPFQVNFKPEIRSLELAELNARVAKLLDKHPDMNFESMVQKIDPDGTIPVSQIVKSYLHQHSLAVLQRFALSITNSNLKIPTGNVVAPLLPFAQTTYGSGFITYQADGDGTVRRISMLAEVGKNSAESDAPASQAKGIYPQLAFAVGTDAFARRCGKPLTVTPSDSDITLTAADAQQRIIPVDDRGRITINWRRGEVYISAAEVNAISKVREQIKNNNRLKRIAQLRLAEGRSDKLIRLFARLETIDPKLQKIQQQRYIAKLYDPANIPPAPTELLQSQALIKQQIDAVFPTFRKDDLEGFFLATVPTEPKDKAIYDELSGLLKDIDEIDAVNVEKLAYINERTKILREKVAGKICLIGSTSIGAADMVSTPLNPLTPGVVVHANIIETILAGDFVIETPWWINALVILTAGAVIIAITVKFSILRAAGLMLLAMGAYVAFCFLVFSTANVWVVIVAPLAGMLAAFVVVTGYRQITEERAKRHIRAMFSHAISPALVDRLMEDPSLAELGGEMRRLSCMFADLAGFTTLSEQLGPQRTVRLLNSYFDRITDVVQNRCGGYINKFLGDGLMVFFGAPVYEDDHPVRAVQGSIYTQRAIAEFNDALREENSGTQVTVRVGITTGDAMVGNCGSSQRMDYTAIGDCVNLSSRLQDTNKFFGTSILIDEETWDAVKDEKLLARPLGRVIVTGRVEPIWIWEIRDLLDDATPQDKQAMTDFSAAMQLFAERKFPQCKTLLESVLQKLPGDTACEVYIELCGQGIAGGEITPKISNEKGLSRIALPWE
ncbi:MAG: adenylate/guanylate cyclase domain-containing protein [Phycisphaerae bacterium]|nr:adenylate/guanylate cyclase domain-containing protein [Phycisphaerae bacterium]